jgi:biopolymer transport protein ExbD
MPAPLQSGDVSRRPMAEINIVPLVDVILVLLIIFMVTAPLMQGGLDLQLPKVAASGLDLTEGLVVDVLADGTMRVGDQMVGEERLEEALARAGAASRPVFVRADQRVPYGVVARVLGRVRQAGVTDVGLVTEPDERRRGRR